MSAQLRRCAPRYLRHGPVSPVAPLTVLLILYALIYTWPTVGSLVPTPAEDYTALELASAAPPFANIPLSLQQLHALGFAYGAL